MNYGPFTATGAIKAGWQLAKKNWIILIGIILGYVIISCLVSFLLSSSQWLNQLVSIVIGAVFGAGYAKMCLDANDETELTFSSFTEGVKSTVPYFVANLLCGIMAMVGFCLFVIPGLWVMARFGLASYIAVDRPELGGVGALKESFRLTKGNDIPMIGLIFLELLVVVVGLICLLVGAFYAAVVCTLASVAAYRMLSYGSYDAGDATIVKQQ